MTEDAYYTTQKGIDAVRVAQQAFSAE